MDQDVGDAVEQGQIGARPERQIQVSHHRGFGDARIRNDQRLVAIGLEVLAEDGVVVGNGSRR